jgi:hypothetical protein
MSETLEEYSKEELIRIIQDYREGHWAKSLAVLKAKKDQIEDEFEKQEINPKSDDGDKLFDNFMKWIAKVKTLNNDIDEMSAKVDPAISLKLRREKERATEFSPEWLASQNSDDDN